MDGIDVLNSLKPDLGHKTGYCDPQRPKSDKNRYASVNVGMYVCTIYPPAFRNYKSQSYENSKLKLDIMLEKVLQVFG